MKLSLAKMGSAEAHAFVAALRSIRDLVSPSISSHALPVLTGFLGSVVSSSSIMHHYVDLL